MVQKSIQPAFFALVFLAIWSPNEALGLPSYAELLRYAGFLGLSAWIVCAAYIYVGLRFPNGMEAIFIAGFLLYLCLSSFWGSGSADSFIKALLIFSAGLTSLSIANTMSLEKALRTVFAVLVLFLILSVIVIIAVPNVGIDATWEHAGKWHGLAGQKNGFGVIAAYTVVAACALPLVVGHVGLGLVRAILFRGAILALALLCLIMAGSRGAQVITTIGVFSLLIAQAPRLLQRLALLGALLLALPALTVVATTLSVEADEISVAGVTIDTNSRMKLWQFGFDELDGRNLTGVGLGSFWTQERQTAFSDTYGWVLDNFHNGYITILIEAGAVGLALYVLAFASLYLLLIIAVGTVRYRPVALAFAYVNMFAILNLVENELGRSTSLLILLFIIIGFSLRAEIVKVLQARSPADERQTLAPAGA